MGNLACGKLLIATNNRGKLAEYKSLLEGVPWELVSPAECGIAEGDFETGDTFEANARLKARGYARLSGLPTLADDSGLEVDALGGRPGVYSARYGGQTTDSGRIELLLRELRGVPRDKRSARFRCVIAIDPATGDEVTLCEGECTGFICLEPRGEQGFGYDPVFCLPGVNRTMAELSFAEKNRISHRARAAARARPVLAKLYRQCVRR